MPQKLRSLAKLIVAQLTSPPVCPPVISPVQAAPSPILPIEPDGPCCKLYPNPAQPAEYLKNIWLCGFPGCRNIDLLSGPEQLTNHYLHTHGCMPCFGDLTNERKNTPCQIEKYQWITSAHHSWTDVGVHRFSVVELSCGCKQRFSQREKDVEALKYLILDGKAEECVECINSGKEIKKWRGSELQDFRKPSTICRNKCKMKKKKDKKKKKKEKKTTKYSAEAWLKLVRS